MLSDLVAVSSNLTHLLVDMGMVISFPTLITHPSRNVLDNDEGLTVSKVFPSPRCFQAPLTAPEAYFTCHIHYFFMFHMRSQ
jgi:hypothetical protein